MRAAEIVAVIAGHLESWYWRLEYAMMPRPRYYNGNERRRNPRTCVLCGGPMRPDTRPERTVLTWFKCGRCHGSQVGVLEA
jgi:hypothetical protein